MCVCICVWENIPQLACGGRSILSFHMHVPGSSLGSQTLGHVSLHSELLQSPGNFSHLMLVFSRVLHFCGRQPQTSYMPATCQPQVIYRPATCQSHASHRPTSCHPQASHMLTTGQLHANHRPVTGQLHANHRSATCQPYAIHMPATGQPQASYMLATFQSQANHMLATCQLHARHMAFHSWFCKQQYHPCQKPKVSPFALPAHPNPV